MDLCTQENTWYMDTSYSIVSSPVSSSHGTFVKLNRCFWVELSQHQSKNNKTNGRFPTVDGGRDVVRVKLTTLYCILEEKAVDANKFRDRGEHLQGSLLVVPPPGGRVRFFLPVSQGESACYVRSGGQFVAFMYQVQLYQRRGSLTLNS